MIHCDVLIIDEDNDDIEILTEALNKNGVEKVHYVHSAKEAFAYLKEVVPKCIPKVIVTEFFFRMSTAIEFMRQFKVMDVYKMIKIVVLSSSKLDQQAEKLRELEVVNYFVKPTVFREYESIAVNVKRIGGM